MKYPNLPDKFKFLKMVSDSDYHPTGYAWVGINGTKDGVFPYIQAWIYAEDEVIQCVEYERTWFKAEMEDLLQEDFVPNMSLEYLVEFVWEEADWSVGIPDGYNCSLVLDDHNIPVVRRYETEEFEIMEVEHRPHNEDEKDPRCFIDVNSKIRFVCDLDPELYLIDEVKQFISILEKEGDEKFIQDTYDLHESLEKLQKEIEDLK